MKIGRIFLFEYIISSWRNWRTSPFLMVPWICLQCVSVIYPEHTHFLTILSICFCQYLSWDHMREFRKFCQRGSNSDIFLVDKGREDKNQLKLGHHRPASETPLNDILLACSWRPNLECWLGSFVIFKEFAPVLLWNPIFLWLFREWGSGIPSPPSNSAHWCQFVQTFKGYCHWMDSMWSFLHIHLFWDICCNF